VKLPASPGEESGVYAPLSSLSLASLSLVCISLSISSQFGSRMLPGIERKEAANVFKIVRKPAQTSVAFKEFFFFDAAVNKSWRIRLKVIEGV
jgi:hypothetical protein